MTARRIAFAFATVAALGACAPGQQGPSERQVGGAAIGAILGATAGALLGGESAREGALIGAGIGLLAGAAVGTYLDEQERALNEDLAGTGAEVTRLEDALLVTLPGGVTFATDSAAVRPEFRAPLMRVAETLAEYPSSFVDVVGHTDSTGTPAYNQGLSERRADAVAEILVANGVAEARLASYGRGQSDPVASNDTPEGRAANRRVEILIVPATES